MLKEINLYSLPETKSDKKKVAVAILSQSLGHLATLAAEPRAQAAAWASNRSCAPDPSVPRNLCRGNTALVDFQVTKCVGM